MFPRTLGAILATASIFLLLASSDAFAQRRGKEDGPKIQTFKVNGKLAGMRGAILQVLDADEKPHLVKLDRKETKTVEVTGTAEVSALRPGMIVAFNAVLNKRGVAEEEVDKLKIVDAGGGLPPGISSDDPTDENAPLWIVGQLKSFKKGKMTVVAGPHQVQAPLAETAKIDVQLSDVSVASPGDEIKVVGKGYQPEQIIAIEVRIVLSEPLGTPAKDKKPPRGRNTRDRRGSAKPSDKDAPDGSDEKE